tara:strand:+ start:1265 stop:1378 length:114 start_codon:yes stop_codon:yes gene_type:complete
MIGLAVSGNEFKRAGNLVFARLSLFKGPVFCLGYSTD